MSHYDRVAKHLWQGSFPDYCVDSRQFKVLVLCAKELQPRGRWPGITVIHAPMDDSGVPMLPEERSTAMYAAKLVAEALRDGKRVLSTCAMGLNRSGLVSALALRIMGGVAGAGHFRRPPNSRATCSIEPRLRGPDRDRGPSLANRTWPSP